LGAHTRRTRHTGVGGGRPWLPRTTAVASARRETPNRGGCRGRGGSRCSRYAAGGGGRGAGVASTRARRPRKEKRHGVWEWVEREEERAKAAGGEAEDGASRQTPLPFKWHHRKKREQPPSRRPASRDRLRSLAATNKQKTNQKNHRTAWRAKQRRDRRHPPDTAGASASRGAAATRGAAAVRVAAPRLRPSPRSGPRSGGAAPRVRVGGDGRCGGQGALLGQSQGVKEHAATCRGPGAKRLARSGIWGGRSTPLPQPHHRIFLGAILQCMHDD